MDRKTIKALIAVACLGWPLAFAPIAKGDSGGRWTRPPTDTTLSGEELYKRDPCLDPENQKPKEEAEIIWADGRSAENPDGECHLGFVWLPRRDRDDGLRIGVIATHGDSSTGYGGSGIVGYKYARRPGMYLFDFMRPGICGRKTGLCSSGETGGVISTTGVQDGSRTHEVVASFRETIKHIREIYKLDIVLVYGESGGVNIMSNAAIDGNADGLFARGTTCDDQQWLQTSDTVGRGSYCNAVLARNNFIKNFSNNVDEMDAIPNWAPGFVVVNMNGKPDINTKPVMAQMCHEEAVKRGINSRLYTPDWLDHGGSMHLQKEDPEKFKESRKELNEAMDWLIDEAVKFKLQSRQATGK